MWGWFNLCDPVKNGGLNTLWGLVLVYLAGNIPYNTWMVKSYMDTVSKSLDEAARIDGAGHFQIFAESDPAGVKAHHRIADDHKLYCALDGFYFSEIGAPVVQCADHCTGIIWICHRKEKHVCNIFSRFSDHCNTIYYLFYRDTENPDHLFERSGCEGIEGEKEMNHHVSIAEFDKKNFTLWGKISREKTHPESRSHLQIII